MILRGRLRLQWHKLGCHLPILLPTTLAVWLLSFIVTFREFTAPSDLGGSGQNDTGPAVVAVCGEHRDGAGISAGGFDGLYYAGWEAGPQAYLAALLGLT